jgi:lipoprotein-anchoring transpeptidase ErfK/SrfK
MKIGIAIAGLGLGLALGGPAQAQSPVWDVFDFSKPMGSPGVFGFAAPGGTGSAFGGAAGTEASAPSGDRPVVTIAAPPQPAASFAALWTTSPSTNSFFDPVERVWVTYDPARASGQGGRSYSPIPREEVAWTGGERAGTIVISTEERRLFLVLGNGRALRYGIGVGRDGFTWRGEKSVTRMAEWPDWRPPEQMLRRRPDLPRFMPGGVANPLGARALYLGSSLYRIHGSNEPHTIGQAVSSGCFRMTNEDVTDLYQRVRVGARVVVR